MKFPFVPFPQRKPLRWQPLHYVENIDTKPLLATRIEFKKGFPTGRRVAP